MGMRGRTADNAPFNGPEALKTQRSHQTEASRGKRAPLAPLTVACLSASLNWGRVRKEEAQKLKVSLGLSLGAEKELSFQILSSQSLLAATRSVWLLR